jgi:prolyl-tRNA editing enzyme YbaK/EbsC (Cys-tRNA(Pro) deacylase)
MFKTQWTHAPVELTEDQQKKLDWEIADISEQLEVASDLIFHTVMLTDEETGPIIIVDAKTDNADTLFLTYYETPEWVDVEIN